MALPGLEIILINDMGIMNLRMEMCLPLWSQLDKEPLYQVGLLLIFSEIVSLNAGMSAAIVK